MSTKFNQKTASTLPAVCHGSIPDVRIAYEYGEPNRLSCLAEWVDPLTGFEKHESIDLNEDGSLPGWSGSSSAVGDNLLVQVTIRPGDRQYDVTITRRSGGLHIDDASWHDVTIPQGPPFDSGQLRHDYPPGGAWDAVHLLD